MSDFNDNAVSAAGKAGLSVQHSNGLAVSTEALLDTVSLSLESCLSGDNFDDLPDVTLSKSRQSVYKTRAIAFPSVELVKLPNPTRLYRGSYHLIESSGCLLAEQIPPPNVLPDLASFLTTTRIPNIVVQVSEPCVLVSRYGLMVWGHWVGELLPRILLVERAFPNRFKFVLPRQVLGSGAPRNVWNSIWDTMRLLGVGRSRLIFTDEDKDYFFDNLYCVTRSNDAAGFHPGLLTAMRDAYIRNKAIVPDRKIAILRTESKSRNITNLIDVVRLLKDHDYEFVEVGVIPFQEQVSLFSSASHVVGVLASGLTSILFSPDHVKIVSMAPEGYINRFFYPIMQSRKASYYDVRGKITDRDPRSDVFSDFRVDVGMLSAALKRVD